MQPHQSEAALRAFLRQRGAPLETLGASRALDLAVEFWLAFPVSRVRTAGGDGLVAYFELLDRGRRLLYEFGVNRVMRSAEESEPWFAPSQGWKLRLSVGYIPSGEVFQLPGLLVPAVACWQKSEASSFKERVARLPHFAAVAAMAPHSAPVGFAECAVPRGDLGSNPEELVWAIA